MRHCSPLGVDLLKHHPRSRCSATDRKRATTAHACSGVVLLSATPRCATSTAASSRPSSSKVRATTTAVARAALLAIHSNGAHARHLAGPSGNSRRCGQGGVLTGLADEGRNLRVSRSHLLGQGAD
jgi:hypothetical protein